MGQVDGALIDMIQQAAGAGHGDFDAGTKLLNLRLYIYTAIDGEAPESGFLSKGDDGLVDLFCQFAGWGDDQGADAAARSFYQALKNRQYEDRCFACPGLCQTHNILSPQYRRDRLNLNRSRCHKTCRRDTGRYSGVKIKCIKFHKFLLSYVWGS